MGGFYKLSQMVIGEDIAPIVAEWHVLAERPGPEETLFGLVGHIKSLEGETPETSTPKATKRAEKKRQPVYLEDDLRLIRVDDPEESYQSLRKRGSVIQLSAYFCEGKMEFTDTGSYLFSSGLCCKID
ncbi:hypothetical protein Q9252_12100 [Marinobacter salarius]|uniref:hypothetical protein n=1 Tax=Marinobacter salarius TaxID=1420917 RepID=UPI00273BA61F|nr:hypothetical protein [Marinobacter salarius]MDP4532887.1 hypothetical protein [Marinobacter salarius]